jgi:acetyl-CoA C-acetyltransferase
MQEIFIVDGKRTPFLKAKAMPLPLAAADLAVMASQNLLYSLPITAENVEELVLGCVAPDASEANIARIVALRTGCKQDTVAYTVQRNCASGLQAIDSAAKDIRLGRHNLVLAGGAEVMSRTPLLFSEEFVIWLAEFKKHKSVLKKITCIRKLKLKYLVPIFSIVKGLSDPVVGLSMGQTAEKLSFMYNISRRSMDEYALKSHLLASAAQQNQVFAAELLPIFDWLGNVYQEDDGIRKDSSLEKLLKLKPVFDYPFGNVTAGNSSQISDGAAMVLLASKQAVKQYGLQPKARIISTAWSALDPSIMGLGPAYAIEKIMEQQNLELKDIDLFEINEAFAGQVLACQEFFKTSKYGELDSNKLNIHGGAISLGHPVGASGARIALHLINALIKKKAKLAIGSLCIGGGQGGAILLERVEGAV